MSAGGALRLRASGPCSCCPPLPHETQVRWRVCPTVHRDQDGDRAPASLRQQAVDHPAMQRDVGRPAERDAVGLACEAAGRPARGLSPKDVVQLHHRLRSGCVSGCREQAAAAAVQSPAVSCTHPVGDGRDESVLECPHVDHQRRAGPGEVDPVLRVQHRRHLAWPAACTARAHTEMPAGVNRSPVERRPSMSGSICFLLF